MINAFRIDKLRIINLIEADLQIIMKACLQIRRDALKSSDRASEFNYGARRGHDIDAPLLEKRLNVDNSMINGKKMHGLLLIGKPVLTGNHLK